MQQLLRTSLFSLFAFVLAAGMAVAPAQAQDITIDQDDNETIDAELDAAQPGDVVRIIAGTYDENVIVSTASTGGSLSDGDQLTIEIETDGSDEDVRLNQFGVDNGIDLTVRTVDGGFVNLVAGGSQPDLSLQSGTFTLNSSSVLEVFGGAQVERTAEVTLAGSAPTFNGTVDAEFVASNGSIDATTSPRIIPNADVDVSVTGSSGNTVTLPSGITIAQLDGSDALDVGSNAAATLNGGTVTGSVTNDGTITDDGGATFQALVDNNGTFTAEAGSSFDAIVENGGTLTANAGVTFSGQVQNGGTAEFLSGTSTYNVAAAGTFDNQSGTVTIAGGATLDVNAVNNGATDDVTALTNDGGVTGAGTLTFTGDANDAFNVDVSGGSAGNEVLADNSGTGGTAAGDITTNRPLTFDEGGTAANAIDVGDITANGTVDFGEGGDDTGAVTTGALDANDTIDFTVGSATGAVTTGDITADADVNLNGIGSDITTGTVTVSGSNTVDFSGSGDGAGDDVSTGGTVTANSGGTVDLSNVSNNVQINTNGSASDAAITTNATVNLNGVGGFANLIGGVELNNGGSFDVTGTDLRLNGTLTQNTNTEFTTTNTTRLELLESATLSHNTITTVGELVFSGSEEATLNEAIRVDDNGSLSGDFTIDGATVLQDNVFMIGGTGGTLSVNATLTQNRDVEGDRTFIEFAGDGKAIAGSQASIANVRIDNGGNDVSLGSDVNVTDRLELLNGGIDAGGNDLSPGQGALVTRNLANDTGISNGTVGGDDNLFDLTYAASSAASANVELEFSDDVRNLTVEGGATAQLVEDEIVSGALAVNAGAQIGDDGNGPWEVELAGDANHTITGLVVQNNGTPVGLNVTGDGTLTGSADDNNESRIEDLTADGTVTVSDIQQIDGDVTVNQGASLDLALADADQSGIDDDADGTDDQTIRRQLTVNGTLTLSSDVEMVKSFTPAVVEVNETGTEGAIEFGANDLFLTGQGARFIASSDQDQATSPFSASNGGRLVFDNNIDNNANAQRINTAGEAVPNVRLRESDDGSRLFMIGDAATSTTLDADEEIDLNGNTFEAGGTATLNDPVSDGSTGGVFRATGNTVTVENDINISQFVADAGTANTLTLESNDPDGNNAPFVVGVPNGFELASGSLSHGATDIDVTGSFAYTGSGDPDTEISAGSGFVNLDNSGLSLSLSNALAVTNLRVSQDADLGTDGVDLTVGNELELDDQFDGSTSNGSIVMANEATLQRLSGTDVNLGVDPLPEALEVPSSGDKYNVTYGEDGDNDYNSAGELVSETISTLTVNTGDSGSLYLNTDVSTDNAVVDELVLNSGNLDYGRQVEIAGNGEVTRRPGAALADAADATDDPNGDTDAPAPLVASGTYTLNYDGDDGSSGGTLTASDREFTPAVSTLETTMGDASAGNSHDVEITNALTANERTVNTLTVNNGTDGSALDLDGNNISGDVLTVNGDASVNGGDLTGSTLDVAGTFTASGGDVDVSAPFTADGLVTVESGASVTSSLTANGGGLTVEGSNSTVSGFVTANGDPDGSESITVQNGGSVTGSVNTDIDITLNGGTLGGSGNPITTQGDITLEGSGNTLAGTGVAVEFDGTTNQTLNLNEQNVDVDSLRLNKGQASPVPRATVTSGEFTTNKDSGEVGLDLNNGLLVVQNISEGNAVDLGVAEFDRSDVDPAAGDTSHVVGNVTRELGDGSGNRIDVDYPVGSANASYRPFQLIFADGHSLDENNITIGHVGGSTPTTNLPIETASGIVIGQNKPNYYWRTQTDENLGINQSFEVAATATGLTLDEPLEDHRLIRQEETSDGNWEIQGADGQYNNTGNSQRALLRNAESTGGLSPLPRRVTVGVPARPPAFTQEAGDQTVDEGAELTAQFSAEVQDPSSSEGSIGFSFDAPSSIEDEVSIDDTGQVSYAPDFDDASGSPYNITVIAEDTDQGTTAESTFEVTVNNVSAPPAYTAPVNDEDVDEGSTITKTFQAEIRDPGSSGNVIYSVDAPAEIRDSIEVDAQTGEFSYTAGFEDASASNDPTEYDVTAKATDSDAQATRDSTFTITVNDDPIAPAFTQEAGDKTTDEGVEVTADFTAEPQDPNSGSDAISYSVSAASAIADSVEIDDTGQVTYTPGFDDAADSPYTLTVTAEDTDAQVSKDASFEVTVNDTGQEPTFTTAPSSGTVDEGAELTADFTAEPQDPGSGSDAISYSVSAASAIADSVEIDDTGQVTYTPGFDDAADSPYTLTVTAEDTDAQTSKDASFEVTVNDVVQGPVFADGSAPSDFDGTVARDTSRESTNPSTIDVAAQAEDPSSAGDQLSFETDADWARVANTSASGDQATATIALEPGFAEAQQAAQGDGTLDVSVTATDNVTDEPVSGVVSVDVGFNPLLGNADGIGSAFSANDAFAALAIAVGKSEIEQGGTTFPLLDGHVRAADVAPPSEGDTLDANRDDVNAFDALQILRGPDQNAGAAVAAQTSAKSPSADGAIQIGEIDRKDGTAVVPVRLAEGAANVQAADIEVTLNSDVASVKDVQANTPDSWISSHNVSDEGVLTVGMAGTSALSSGKIATVRLDVSGSEKPFEEGSYQLNGADEKDLTVDTRPSEFTLKSNYPNPVQTSTTIEYELKEARSVTMEVYNTLGQRVATLVDEEKPAGSHSVSWEAGGQVSSGVYFYRIEAGDFTETKRITVVR